MSRKAFVIITTEKNVSCLKGYEDFDTESISRRMPRKFFLRTCTELQFKKEKKEGKIPVFKI